MNVIDKSKPIPLYYQLRELLEEQIQNNELLPGDKLPTEDALSKQFGISRITVRKAIEDMIVNGTLVRKRGESPVVAFPKINRDFNKLTGISREMEKQNIQMTSELLSYDRRPATKQEAKHLGLEVGTEIIFMRRLRLLENAPIIVQDVLLNLDYCKDIEIEAVKNGSLYKEFSRLQLQINNAVQTISARKASAEEVRILRISTGDPVLDMRRTVYLDNKDILEYSRSAFVADKYKITTTLYP